MLRESVVHIELTSTLTQEDENKLAPAVLKAISGMLEMLPIAYMIRARARKNHRPGPVVTTSFAAARVGP